MSRRETSGGAPRGRTSPRAGWGPDDWAHLRRGRRIAGRHRRERRRRWAAWGGGAAAAALVATTAAGLSARALRPTDGWVPQIAALVLPALPVVLGVSAAVAGVFAVRSRRPAAVVGAVALALAAAAVWGRTPTPPAAGGGAGGLRVMTLNAGRTSAEASLRVAEFVGRTAPDVVLLQEVDVRSVSRDGDRAVLLHPTVQAVLGAGAYRVGGRVDTTVSDRSGPANRQVVLSRLPVVAHTAGTLGPSNTDPSLYARVEVEWAGRRVALYNVHLRPFNPTAGWSLRRALDPAVWSETPARLRSFFAVQAEEAERLAALLDAETLPFVVAGDFNATPDQWSRALLARRAPEALGRRLWAPTRPDAFPVAPIDGVLAGPGWAVRSASVGPPGLSDHRAVSAELVLTPGR